MSKINDLINKDIKLNKECPKIIEKEKSTDEPSESQLEFYKAAIVNFIKELIITSKYVFSESEYKWITQTVRNWKTYLKVHFSDYSRWEVPARDDLIKEDWYVPNSFLSKFTKDIAAELVPNITKEAVSELISVMSERITEEIIPKIVKQVKMELKSEVGEKTPGYLGLPTDVLGFGGRAPAPIRTQVGTGLPQNPLYTMLSRTNTSFTKEVGNVQGDAVIIVRGSKTDAMIIGSVEGDDIQNLRFKGIDLQPFDKPTASLSINKIVDFKQLSSLFGQIVLQYKDAED